MDCINKCWEYIDKNLNDSRKIHILGVKKTSEELAYIYGADVEKAGIAAVFHDMCKSLTNEECNIQIEKYKLNKELIDNKDLAHGPIAACWAEEYYNVKDEDILNAIRYHTSAREGMSLLEKIVFVADAVEPSRKYPDAAKLLKEAMNNLEEVYKFIIFWMMQDLERRGITPGYNTVKAYEECLSQLPTA